MDEFPLSWKYDIQKNRNIEIDFVIRKSEMNTYVQY
jgi:hypothetical protein